MLNDAFVSGLLGLAPVHPQRSRSLQYTHVLRSLALMSVVGASCFPNLYQSFLFQFRSQNSASILRELL